MKSDDEFFAELHPQVVEVLGTAVMQVSGREERTIKGSVNRNDSGAMAGG